MFEVKTEIKIIPDGYESTNRYFHKHVLNNYLELGVTLVGRWVNEDKTVITEIWGYLDEQHYRDFFELRKQTKHYQNSLPDKLANDKWIISKKDMLITPTGDYKMDLHIVSTNVLVQNNQGEVLLVRSLHRSDTLELPGGRLDKDEDMIAGAKREVKEETGLDVDIKGLLYSSHNKTSGVVNFTFLGEVVGGTLKDGDDETIDVGYYPVNPENISEYVTRKISEDRILKALEKKAQMFDLFENNPYKIITSFK
ncbi:NUDIX hydrolase [Macrococcoides caseolyticum]|uniref:NUDIX hydrolase n=1 Tax=Macrococcoides caseolyticum TaxID=69966 RepID=UPI001F1EC5A5|nr:NUDIX hydrolase [Macrococcus caseolyticus]MCE4957427.1 NUDIX hydrolase [Macrococcus caseolyticus]